MLVTLRVKDPDLGVVYTASVDDDNQWTIPELPRHFEDGNAEDRKEAHARIARGLAEASERGERKMMRYIPWSNPEIVHAYTYNLIAEWAGSEITSKLPPSNTKKTTASPGSTEPPGTHEPLECVVKHIPAPRFPS